MRLDAAFNQRWRLPLSRDQIMLMMVAINLLFLGLDTYLAHLISGTIVAREWIPIIFGTVAGILMLATGLIAFKNRMLANVIATTIMTASIAVGLLGTFFHLIRAANPTAPAGARLTTELLIWAPPVAGPFAFVMVGILGISAAWQEDTPDSGVLILPGQIKLALPYSKTRAYLYIVCLGILAAVLSSVLDHSRTGFASGYEFWLPLAVGTLGTIAAFMLAIIEAPTRADLMTYIVSMGLLIAVGVLGFYFHVRTDIQSQGQIVIERFLRGAPLLAPLLFANMGMLGLVSLLSPEPISNGE